MSDTQVLCAAIDTIAMHLFHLVQAENVVDVEQSGEKLRLLGGFRESLYGASTAAPGLDRSRNCAEQIKRVCSMYPLTIKKIIAPLIDATMSKADELSKRYWSARQSWVHDLFNEHGGTLQLDTHETRRLDEKKMKLSESRLMFYGAVVVLLRRTRDVLEKAEDINLALDGVLRV